MGAPQPLMSCCWFHGHQDKVFLELEVGDATTEVSREIKLEAVKLVRERDVAVSQAARDLDLHENVLRKWVGEQSADAGSAFPGHGVMKREQQEMSDCVRELARMKAERDILKKRRPTSPGTRYEV